MRTISKLVTNLPWKTHHKALLEAAVPEATIVYVSQSDSTTLQKEIVDAEVVVITGRPDVSEARKLQWMHWDAAGLDSIANDSYIHSGFMITGSAGRSAPALAEHALFFMLNHAYQIRTVLAAQKKHQWGYPGQQEMKALFSQTIGIIGMGHTGYALARRAKALNMRVLAYSRSTHECPDVDQMYSESLGNCVDEILPECDFVVMAAALTDKTYHMLGKKQFQAMKTSSFLVNVGRGKTIDEDALLEALRLGEIAGAGLDTFGVEPLPENSPLWDEPNVYITPHFTPACPDKLGRSLNIVIENVGLYRRGEQLINLLRLDDAYTIR